MSNFGEYATAEDISVFFKLNRDERTKENSAVEISQNASGRIALIHVPEEIFPEAMARHGTELAGNIIQVKDPAQTVLQPALSQFQVANFGPSITVDQLSEFLGFNTSEEARKSCSIAISTCKTFAIVVVPQCYDTQVVNCHGNELDGRTINVVPGFVGSGESSPDDSPEGRPKNEPERTDPPVQANPLTTLAQVAAGSMSTHDSDMPDDHHVNEYVSIDTTRCHNCYNVPTHAEIIRAIAAQFPKTQDPYRNVLRLRGKAEGIWKIESSNIELYRKSQILKYGSQELGYVEIRKEVFRKDASGNVTKERVRKTRDREDLNEEEDTPDKEEDDLLITLYQANTERFTSVTNEMLLGEIATMDVGELKKAPQPQRYKGTDELNGNKFFVLSKVSEDVAKQIPTHFMFFDARYGWQKMWLNHRLRKRYCSFCGTEHETECPTKALFAQLKEERKATKEASPDNNFQVHMMGDSTLRYAEQQALAVDIHAMSGATTGNILNAVEVNDEHQQVKNLIIVAGQNELQSDLTQEEFLLCLKLKEERLRALATEKKVAILTPPPMKPIDPVEQAKEIFFHQHLATIEEEVENLKVWSNPIEQFEEDDGRHPNPEQTAILLHHLNSKSTEDFGVPIFLKSGPSELMITKRKYSGVKALYKYGCGACADRARNKWWSICNNCITAAEDTDKSGLGEALEVLRTKANEIRNIENPPLQDKAEYRERSPHKTDGNTNEEKSDGREEHQNGCKRFKFCSEER